MNATGSGRAERGGDPAARGRWDARLAAEHARAFAGLFPAGAAPRVFFAPGRVNLMGAHLDYNGGPVMPTAIDRGTFVAVRPRLDGRIVLASTLDGARAEAQIGALPAVRSRRWADYPLGVLREILALADAQGALGHGLDVLFGGNLAVGAGLSSSASICVATAFALDAVFGLGLPRIEIVHAALRAERGFVGVQCGIMDPYAVGLARGGSLLWLDCKDRTSEHLPLDPARVSIAVADTLVRRELAQGAFNERVAECRAAFDALRAFQPDATCLRDVRLETLAKHARDLDPTPMKRARHVVEEVGRTFAAREALRRGDLRGFGAAMTLAHESLREHFEVSVPELDRLVASAIAVPGVLGARLTGAGFGGCAVILLERGAEADLEGRIVQDFTRAFGRAPRVEFFGGDSGPRELDLGR
ncbi:MAG: galactokinase [Planctomycetes bacterium]|nr:galactokinase [Planctomycetota bacterium]